MKKLDVEDELGRDRNLEVETDDEENQADSRYSSPTSSSSNRSEDDDRNEDGESFNGGQKQAWPQSYRQSIDMLSSVVQPPVALMGSSLIEASTSFLRFPSSLSEQQPPKNLSRPLIIPYYNAATTVPVSLSSRRPSSFLASSIPSFAKSLPPSPQCTTTQAIVNGLNVMCGVGLLTTPYALQKGGWLSIMLLFVFANISFYTGILLKRCLDSGPGLQTYPDIGQAAFGMKGRIFVSIVLYLELYLCCVEYITLVGDSLEAMFPGTHLNFLGLHLRTHQLFALTTTFAVLPSVWLRDLSLLSYLSAGGVIATIVVIICLFWVGIVDGVGFHRAGTALDLMNLPVALGLYGFCYSGHSVFPNIYSSMRTRDEFPKVLLICVCIVTVAYAAVASAGLLMFGDAIKSQFTLNMPGEFLISKLAIWTTVINPLSKYALTMTPVALSIEELLPLRSQESHSIVVLIRTLLVFSTLFVALSIPFFGLVMALLGSVFTMLVALIMPCACYLSIQRSSIDYVQVTACVLIIIAGVLCSVVGSYSSIMKIISMF